MELEVGKWALWANRHFCCYGIITNITAKTVVVRQGNFVKIRRPQDIIYIGDEKTCKEIAAGAEKIQSYFHNKRRELEEQHANQLRALFSTSGNTSLARGMTGGESAAINNNQGVNIMAEEDTKTPEAQAAAENNNASTGDPIASDGEGDTETTSFGGRVHDEIVKIEDDFHDWFESGKRDAKDVLDYIKSKLKSI